MTKINSNQLLSQHTCITNVHYCDATACCRNDAACW